MKFITPARSTGPWQDSLAGLPLLSITTEAEILAAEFLRTGALPLAVHSDAVHLAVAAVA